jgi:hypothetical protein
MCSLEVTAYDFHPKKKKKTSILKFIKMPPKTQRTHSAKGTLSFG